jgi:hypothetical protein
MRDTDIHETRRTEPILTWTRSSAFATTLFYKHLRRTKTLFMKAIMQKIIDSKSPGNIFKENRHSIKGKQMGY